MKKIFILVALCFFGFVSVQAQNSRVETATQSTKAEQFKTRNSLIKEAQIYQHRSDGLRVFVKLFTDLKTNEKLVALEFWSAKTIFTMPLGYLDMDKVDDLLLALETILKEVNQSDRGDKYSITYTAEGGLDVCYQKGVWSVPVPPGSILFRKKWYYIDNYGVETCKYSEGFAFVEMKDLPKLIDSIKEASEIAKQALAK